MVRVAFTGTRIGMSSFQQTLLQDALEEMLTKELVEFHHGDCTGADEQAHRIAKTLGCRVVVHPPTNPKCRAYVRDAEEYRPEGAYLQRDDEMLNECVMLFAAPKDERVEEHRGSGTWYTIRAACLRAMPITILPRESRFRPETR